MPNAEVENLIIWNDPKYNPCLALIWLNRSAPLLRLGSHGWKPASMQVNSLVLLVTSSSKVSLWLFCGQCLLAGSPPNQHQSHRGDSFLMSRCGSWQWIWEGQKKAGKMKANTKNGAETPSWAKGAASRLGNELQETCSAINWWGPWQRPSWGGVSSPEPPHSPMCHNIVALMWTLTIFCSTPQSHCSMLFCRDELPSAKEEGKFSEG